VSNLYRLNFRFQDNEFEIAIRNRVHLSKDSSYQEAISSVKSYDELWSDALVIIGSPKISKEGLDRLRNWKPDKGSFPITGTEDMFKAMQALNHFVIAYATTTKNVYGGSPLRLFRPSDYFAHHKWQIAIIAPKGEPLTNENIIQMLEWRPNIKISSLGSLWGQLDDIGAEDLVGIENTMSLQNDFVFFEIAFEAKSKMASDDYIGALLMAVAALEGAHAAFVHHELGARLNQNSDRSLPDEFIRELGLHLCNRLTPYLLMGEAERPSQELIQQCEKGIKIRNEIMHALKNNKGKYRLRTRTHEEISNAYSGVLRVYNCYVSALLNRLEHKR
jgi:hypothetical protein